MMAAKVRSKGSALIHLAATSESQVTYCGRVTYGPPHRDQVSTCRRCSSSLKTIDRIAQTFMLEQRVRVQGLSGFAGRAGRVVGISPSGMIHVAIDGWDTPTPFFEKELKVI